MSKRMVYNSEIDKSLPIEHYMKHNHLTEKTVMSFIEQSPTLSMVGDTVPAEIGDEAPKSEKSKDFSQKDKNDTQKGVTE